MWAVVIEHLLFIVSQPSPVLPPGTVEASISCPQVNYVVCWLITLEWLLLLSKYQIMVHS